MGIAPAQFQVLNPRHIKLPDEEGCLYSLTLQQRAYCANMESPVLPSLASCQPAFHFNLFHRWLTSLRLMSLHNSPGTSGYCSFFSLTLEITMEYRLEEGYYNMNSLQYALNYFLTNHLQLWNFIKNSNIFFINHSINIFGATPMCQRPCQGLNQKQWAGSLFSLFEGHLCKQLEKKRQVKK